jgi:hypothetical protein
MDSEAHHGTETGGFMSEKKMVDYFTKDGVRHNPGDPEKSTKNVVKGLTQKERDAKFSKWFEEETHFLTYGHHEPISGKIDEGKKGGSAIFTCDNITDEWYRWFFSVPGSMNPSANPGKLYGDRNSQGDRNVFTFDKRGVSVYFAASSPFQEPDVRTITLTRRAPLLVPVYNVSASLQSYPSKDRSELAEMVKDDLLGVKGETFEASFDQYNDPPLFGCCVVREEPITITNVPADNIFGIPEDRLRESNWTTETCHGGFWLLIKERFLTPGDHLLSFKAESVNYAINSKFHIRVLC